MANNWKDLFTLWNTKLQNIGNPANAYRVEELLPEPGLVDVSGIFTPMILGQAARGLNLANNAYKSIEVSPKLLSVPAAKPKSIPIDAERGVNYRNWANGEPTEILYRGQEKNYPNMSPREGIRSKHNSDGIYFGVSPRTANRYISEDLAMRDNITQVHAKTGGMFDWSLRNKTSIPKEVREELRLGKDTTRVSDLQRLPQERQTQVLKKMGYKGIKDGDERIFFYENMYKSVNNSGAFSKTGDMMHSAIGIGTGTAVATQEDIKKALEKDN